MTATDTTVASATRRVFTPRLAVWAAAALVVLMFGLPLFTQLGSFDLMGDEAIYSFAIDRMLDGGDWLTPRSIPDERNPFLEKPPLKFWMVAGSIRAGLLPQNEYGYRFWDAVFGSAAFLYLFAIGYRIEGIVAGLTAVLVLFSNPSLVLDHGLRSNNMEAALLLAYCGGIFHFLAWSKGATRARRSFHAIAIAFLFAFGFLMKFVAVIFLPAILAVAAAFSPRWRRQAVRDWPIALAAVAVAAVLILPWFAYETRVYGHQFWQTIFGLHILVRFTSFLDPGHVKPWSFYLKGILNELWWADDLLLVVAGLVLVGYRAVRKRSDTAVLILAWFVVPLVVISASTSKLYHYVYPFLPPLALAAGLVPNAVMEWANAHRPRIVHLLERVWPPRFSARLPRRVRTALIGVALMLLAIAIVNPITGGIGLRYHGRVVFRNSTTSRPLALATVLLVVTGLAQMAPTGVVVAVLLTALPFDAYRDVRTREVGEALWTGTPMRTLRACLVDLQSRGAGRGVYVYTQAQSQWRYAYYLRDAGWNEEQTGNEDAALSHVLEAGQLRPVLLSGPDYLVLRQRLASSGRDQAVHQLESTPRIVFDEGWILLLPDGYGDCRHVSGAAVRRGG